MESLNRRGNSALTALVVLILGLLPLVATVVASRVAGFEVSDATRDAIDVMGAPAYVGFVSNLGTVVWIVSATCCLFAAAVMANGVAPSSDVRFLIATGLLTTLAAVDDLFLLHERVITPVAGGSEGAYVVFWAVVLVVYSVVAGRFLLRYRSPLLVVVVALFLLSLSIDVFAPFTDVWTFVEDAAKYLGIVFWAAYIVPLSYRLALPPASLPSE